MVTQTIPDTMGPLDKLMTADMARLMADNQRVLDRTNRRAEAFAKWEASQLGEKMPEPADDMQIAIDSPVVHHNYPPPVQPQQQSSGLGSLIGAALVGASLVGIPGAGIASYLYAKSQAEPAKPDTTVIEQREDLGLGLLKLEDLKQ